MVEPRTRRRSEVMLIGLAGCGKTQSCLGLLKSLPPDVFTYYVAWRNLEIVKLEQTSLNWES